MKQAHDESARCCPRSNEQPARPIPVPARVTEPDCSGSVMPNTGSRLHFLDAIRGLAALTVVASHYNMAYGLPGSHWIWTNTPLRIWWDGFAAVSLFFVLSGFVLSFRHLQNQATATSWQFSFSSYCVARVCRIWLPYLAVMMIAATVQQLVRIPSDTSPPPGGWLLRHWYHSLTASQMVHDANLLRHSAFLLVPQAWTLAIELMLSLLVPVGILVAKRSSWWLLATTVFAAVILGVSAFSLHFALGILLAKHCRQMGVLLSARPFARALLLLVGLSLYTSRYTIPVYLGLGDDGRWIWAATGMGAALMLLSTLVSRSAQRLLAWPPLRYCGTVSYSIYLIHMVILAALTPQLIRLLNHMGMVNSWLAGLIFTVAATLAASRVTYMTFEMPSMLAGKRLAQWLCGHRRVMAMSDAGGPERLDFCEERSLPVRSSVL